MGYTHYYYTRKELDAEAFKKISKDFTKIIPVFEHLGVKLGDGFGENSPIITDTEIIFNGLTKCGHTERHLGITWPSKEAKGVSNLSMQHRLGNDTSANIDGHWFAGAKLDTRTCGGDCSHETFIIEAKMQVPEWKKKDVEQNKRIFNCTKTAYKPYDLAVTACLIIAKHYLGNEILVASEGELKDWNDGMQICEHFLGYGQDFTIDDTEKIMESEEKKILEEKVTELKKQDKTVVKVGDIFYCSWGYDQTNIDYVKVVKINPSGKGVKAVSIGQSKVKDIGYMSEIIEPDPENILSNEFNLRIQERNLSDNEKILRGTYHKSKDRDWTHFGTLWRYDSPNRQSHYA